MDFIQEKEKMPICCHYTEQQSEVIMETVWIHKVR